MRYVNKITYSPKLYCLLKFILNKNIIFLAILDNKLTTKAFMQTIKVDKIIFNQNNQLINLTCT